MDFPQIIFLGDNNTVLDITVTCCKKKDKICTYDTTVI